MLQEVAADPSVRVAWTEPSLDLPGPDRDQADLFELSYDLTDPIEILMRRQGLTESEAIEAYRGIQRRKAIAAALQADPLADVGELAALPGSEADAEPELPDDDAPIDAPTSDMGLEAGRMPDPQSDPEAIVPTVSATVAVTPDMPIPAAPLLLPATPGFGSWGTES